MTSKSEYEKIKKELFDTYTINKVEELNLKLSNENRLEVSSCIAEVMRMLKDVDYYLYNGYNVGNVKKEFYGNYKETMMEYIKFYCNELTKELYEEKFSSEQKKYVIDRMSNLYNIEKMNMKEITMTLNNEFSKFVPKNKTKNESADIINFKEYKKHGVLVKKDPYDILKDEVQKKIDQLEIRIAKHPMYVKLINNIVSLKRDSQIKLDTLFDLYKKKATDEVAYEINYEVNTLIASIQSMLDKAYELSLAKTNALKYLNKLIKNKYFDPAREQEFVDRINNARTLSAVYKYHDILFTNYYYPKKAREIKKRLGTKVEYWIKRNKKAKKDFEGLKKYFNDLLDHGVGVLDEKALIKMDNMGINTAYEVIEEMKEENNKKR